METDFLARRTATLANGDRISLKDAVLGQLRLHAQLALEDQEWDVVYHLREVCLGRSIEPAAERFLIRDGWLQDDGTVAPALRSVVLSGVRGEGRSLRLDSPYTDSVDCALAAFFVARAELLAKLDLTDVNVLFDKPQLERAFDALRDESASDRAAAHLTDADIRSFVRRVTERADRSNPPGNPPPPK